MQVPYSPSVVLSGMCPRETKTGSTCTQVFLAALYIIANNQKQADVLWSVNG